MEYDYEKVCVIKGCPAKPVCLDFKNYTKWRDVDPFITDFDEAVLNSDREIWFCSEHAVTYLFPVIDAATGYTTRDIVNDFKLEGMWK